MKSKKMKFVLAILLAVAMLLSFASCAKPADNEPEPEESSAPPQVSEVGVGEEIGGGNEDAAITEKPEGIQPGTVFTLWTNTDFPSHMPWTDNNASQLQYQLYDNLLYRYHGDQNDVRGNVAENWDISDDGLTWVFKLKDDVFFTNGKQVTAEAFVKSWDAAKDYQGRNFAVVESYEATGEFELTVKLSSASPTFIYELPMQPNCGVVDPELLEQYGPEDNRAAIGCGAYYIEEYASGEKIVLKANPNYHNPDKAPSIETCELEVIPDLNTALMGLMGGQLDCLTTGDMEAVNSLLDGGWELAAWESRSFPWWFNAGQVEIFKDAAVREGLCHMVDWNAVNDLVYDGKYRVPDSYWAGPGSYPYGPGYDYDPELGVKMIEDAGYTKDDIAFTVVVNPNFVAQMTAILAQFQELGFNNIVMETYDASTCLGMMRSGTFEMTVTHNGYSNENPMGPYMMGLVPDAAQPVMTLKYMNEEAYEEALQHMEAAKMTHDFEEYEKETSEVTRICQENFIALGALQAINYYAVAPEFSGLYIYPIAGYFDFCYLYSNVG